MKASYGSGAPGIIKLQGTLQSAFNTIELRDFSVWVQWGKTVNYVFGNFKKLFWVKSQILK